jgi:hypothetical protein
MAVTLCTNCGAAERALEVTEGHYVVFTLYSAPFLSLMSVLASFLEVDDVAMLKSYMRKQDQASSGPMTTVSEILLARGARLTDHSAYLLTVPWFPSGFVGLNCRGDGEGFLGLIETFPRNTGPNIPL